MFVKKKHHGATERGGHRENPARRQTSNSPSNDRGLAGDQFTVRVTLVELVSDPDVPVSVSLLEPTGVPPVGVWWLPQPATSIARPTAAGSKPRLVESLCLRSRNAKRMKRSVAAYKIARKLEGGCVSTMCVGVTSDGLVVATVTVATTGVTPSEGVTDDGEIEQVDIAGAPLHARGTAALNPPDGVTVNLNATVSP
jgi:hypothetical protein